jgi:putative DNA primase/helicase
MPAPREAEDLAAALTNRPPSARPEGAPKQWWYDLTTRVIRLPDGDGHPVRADLHPDPDCEAIRWAICEGELIQAIGRARAVNRTATDPVEIDILTDVVLPGEVHTVVSWTDVRPGRIEAMIAEGVFLENAADRARAFPDLWETAEQAKKDAQRSGTFCYYRNSLIAKCPCPLRVRYRLTGPGQKLRDAIFDASVVPDPQAWLQARVGPLAACHLIDLTEENASEPASRQADPDACAPEDAPTPDTPFSFWMCPQPRPEGKE